MNRLIIILVIFLSVGQSCKKDKTEYSSIIGQWIAEDNGDLSAYRRYDLSIERTPYDSSLYIIHNFYRTGNTSELFAILSEDSVLINSQVIGGYTINGIGIVNGSYDTINFKYSVYGSSIGSENVIGVFHRN